MSGDLLACQAAIDGIAEQESDTIQVKQDARGFAQCEQDFSIGGEGEKILLQGLHQGLVADQGRDPGLRLAWVVPAAGEHARQARRAVASCRVWGGDADRVGNHAHPLLGLFAQHAQGQPVGVPQHLVGKVRQHVRGLVAATQRMRQPDHLGQLGGGDDLVCRQMVEKNAVSKR